MPLDSASSGMHWGASPSAQKTRRKSLSDFDAIAPRRTPPRNPEQEELVQAALRDIALIATKEMALRGPQHEGEAIT